MSVKKKSIEEKLSQCVFYNLSILKQAVKTTPEFDENLSAVNYLKYFSKIILMNYQLFPQTMFMKSNTKAFIHITHFLFNIIDSKEFSKKFYWPIVEKKNENSYRLLHNRLIIVYNSCFFLRSSSVDFINSLIDKHNLSQEKIKLVAVVHPCGKKFLSLILDLIAICIKDIMRRRKIPSGKSFDIEKVTQVCINMKEVENDLVNSINNETKVIKEKTEKIQEILNKKIYPQTEFPMSFSEFIASWHEENQNQFQAIKERSERMKNVQVKTRELCAKAEDLLAQKTYEVTQEPLEVIKSIVEFYENAGVTNEQIPPAVVDEKLNFPWLIAQLHLVLPAITAYISNSSFESAESSNEELKVLKRLSLELVKIEGKFDLFASQFRKRVPAMVEKLRKKKEERQRIESENASPEKVAIRAAKEQIEMESLNLLSSPRYYFDSSKDCLKNVIVKKNRLALIDEDDGKENLNESKFYRPAKSPYVNKSQKMNMTISNEMGPPKLQPRRRLDPMALLEKATSKVSKSRVDLNGSRYTGTVPKVSLNKFSSTMLSPDLNSPVFFNCSTVSAISKTSPHLPFSPVIESMFGNDTVKSKDTSIPWDDTVKMKSIQMSPKGGLKSLVPLEEIFKGPPKVELNNETLTETTENTLCEEKSENSDNTSFNCTSIMMMKIKSDEDLFNTSDTVLQQLDSSE